MSWAGLGEQIELWKTRAHEEAWAHHDDEGLYPLPEWFEEVEK